MGMPDDAPSCGGADTAVAAGKVLSIAWWWTAAAGQTRTSMQHRARDRKQQPQQRQSTHGGVRCVVAVVGDAMPSAQCHAQSYPRGSPRRRGGKRKAASPTTAWVEEANGVAPLFTANHPCTTTHPAQTKTTTTTTTKRRPRGGGKGTEGCVSCEKGDTVVQRCGVRCARRCSGLFRFGKGNPRTGSNRTPHAGREASDGRR